MSQTGVSDEALALDTPEAAVSEFLAGWHESDWGRCEYATQLTWKAAAKEHGREARELIQRRFQSMRLLTWEIAGEPEPVRDSRVMVDVPVRCLLRTPGGNTKARARTFVVRVISEHAPWVPRVGGTWGVNPASAARPWSKGG